MVTKDEMDRILCLLSEYLEEYLSIELTEDIVDNMAVKMQEMFDIEEGEVTW